MTAIRHIVTQRLTMFRIFSLLHTLLYPIHVYVPSHKFLNLWFFDTRINISNHNHSYASSCNMFLERISQNRHRRGMRIAPYAMSNFKAKSDTNLRCEAYTWSNLITVYATHNHSTEFTFSLTHIVVNWQNKKCLQSEKHTMYSIIEP